MALLVQYAPFSSSVDPGFWQILTNKKLNEFGLDESQQRICGFFSNANAPGIPAQIAVDYTAFNSDWKAPSHHFPAVGALYNTNTIEKFKDIDKKELVSSIGKQLWQDMVSGKVLEQPEKLCPFILLTFADLKKYHYYYWFAFPAFKFPEKSEHAEPPKLLSDCLQHDKLSQLVQAYDTFQAKRSSFSLFCLIVPTEAGFEVREFHDIDSVLTDSSNVMVGVCDPSSVPGYPGWVVRNMVTFLACRFGGKVQSVKLVCIRDRTHNGKRDFGQSLVCNVSLQDSKTADLSVCPECVGWEKNERQKLGPRMVNLSSTMDPTRLAESAVDLNLRLMRWRLVPDLDLEKIGATRCLILGSGTLGCNVARLLMGWGIHHLTLVDNSKISYSNPVRQSLFTFKNCLDGGQHKAQAAAASLREIFPGMKSEGLNLSIPMPGHTVPESMVDQIKEDVRKLEELIASHDVVFLLMDTRESRWLPTVIANSKKKIVINAALGFDTFLVLRHGVRINEVETNSPGMASSLTRIPGSQLGCYFCNDVVAPGNSTRDRTLDQQCTVTRPGVSMIAAALAVELLVSLSQHPKGADAEADTSANDDHLVRESDCSLGLVPHQIRGFLSRFHQILPASQSFAMCTGCSPLVVTKYEEEGFEFLLHAFNEPGYLEDLTGLAAMQDAIDDSEVWGLSDDDDMSSVDMET